MQKQSFSQMSCHDKPNTAGFGVSEQQQGQQPADMTIAWM